MTDVVFVDTETTGLNPGVHEIWEVAAIKVGDDGQVVERVWQLHVDLARAETEALRKNRFYERRWDPAKTPKEIDQAIDGTARIGVPAGKPMMYWARQFARFTVDAHLVGVNISFDEERLRKLLRRLGSCPMWDHHLVDVLPLAAGALRLPPPWVSDDLADKLGVTITPEDRHTALGDARWARAIYDTVMLGDFAPRAAMGAPAPPPLAAEVVVICAPTREVARLVADAEQLPATGWVFGTTNPARYPNLTGARVIVTQDFGHHPNAQGVAAALTPMLEQAGETPPDDLTKWLPQEATR